MPSTPAACMHVSASDAITPRLALWRRRRRISAAWHDFCFQTFKHMYVPLVDYDLLSPFSVSLLVPSCVWADEEYGLVGLLVGLAVYSGVILDVPLPLVVFKKVLGTQLSLKVTVLPSCVAPTSRSVYPACATREMSDDRVSRGGCRLLSARCLVDVPLRRISETSTPTSCRASSACWITTAGTTRTCSA